MTVKWFKLLFTNESKNIITDRYFFSDKSMKAINNYFIELFKVVGCIEIRVRLDDCLNKKLFEDIAKDNNIKIIWNQTYGHADHGRSIELKNCIIKLDDGIDVFAESNPKEKTFIVLISK